VAVLLALVRQETRLALRAGGGFGLGLLFFALVVSMTPFAIGPDLVLLGRIGPAILWLGALLASLLGLDRMFASDAEDGSLDQFALAAVPLEVVVAAKIIAHWLLAQLPLVLSAPVLALALNVPAEALGALTLALLVGTPALSSLGAIGAALTVGLRRGGLLVPVLILPLSVPVLIFGVATTNAATSADLPVGTPLQVLAGLMLFYAALAPFAAAAALRAGHD
jgi:heme exporter protein B